VLQPALKSAETFSTFKVLHSLSAIVALSSAVIFKFKCCLQHFIFLVYKNTGL